MAEDRTPVTTAAELSALEDADADILEGYRDALASEADDLPPGGNRSKAYWHGWRNGRTDRGFAPVDEAQHLLIRDIRRTGYFRARKEREA